MIFNLTCSEIVLIFSHIIYIFPVSIIVGVIFGGTTARLIKLMHDLRG